MASHRDFHFVAVSVPQELKDLSDAVVHFLVPATKILLPDDLHHFVQTLDELRQSRIPRRLRDQYVQLPVKIMQSGEVVVSRLVTRNRGVKFLKLNDVSLIDRVGGHAGCDRLQHEP
jgi:hypothetical protein